MLSFARCAARLSLASGLRAAMQRTHAACTVGSTHCTKVHMLCTPALGRTLYDLHEPSQGFDFRPHSLMSRSERTLARTAARRGCTTSPLPPLCGAAVAGVGF